MKANDNRKINGSPIHCYYGNEARVMTLWTNLNPGIRFLGCQNYKVILCLFINFFKFILGVFVDICSNLVQKYGGCGFFLWYDGPMCDRSKQIIPGLLNVVKKKENEVVINWRKVKCMFWWWWYHGQFVCFFWSSQYRKIVFFWIKTSQSYLEIRRLPTWFEFYILCKHFEQMRKWTISVNILGKQHVGALMELLCNFVVNRTNKLNYKFAAQFFTFWFLIHSVQMIYVGTLHYAFWANAVVRNMQLISRLNIQLFDLFPWTTTNFQVLPLFITKRHFCPRLHGEHVSFRLKMWRRL